ncbi:hypothetical protein PBAL39_15429 [Pedobacter sp. BAL39]|nr:hypothetical protein PBAL39_15429 [Pedobacter sp. BAL39]
MKNLCVIVDSVSSLKELTDDRKYDLILIDLPYNNYDWIKVVDFFRADASHLQVPIVGMTTFKNAVFNGAKIAELCEICVKPIGTRDLLRRYCSIV